MKISNVQYTIYKQILIPNFEIPILDFGIVCILEIVYCVFPLKQAHQLW